MAKIAERTETRVEMHDFPACLFNTFRHKPEYLHIRATEPVNRLFVVANKKQTARARNQLAPIALFKVCAGQVRNNLRLNRIGVLKLVHEQRPILPLQMGPHGCIVPKKSSRPKQEILERKPPFFMTRAVGIRHRIVHKARHIPVQKFTPLTQHRNH